MKKFAIGALCSVASLAFAQEGTMETTTMGDSPIKVFANVDLNVAKLTNDGTGGDLDVGYNLAVGTDGVYMLTQEMGVGLGLDFNMLKGDKDFSGTNVEVSNTYLDVPVSFAYNLEAMPELNFMFLAGPYVGIALSDWETKAGGTTTKDNGKMALGLNLETHATWTITEAFALGGHIGFKYDFTDLSEATGDQKYWAVGIGVGAKFL
ncbi:MAG: outer membrane beta-barrel protein [Bdellovibrionota bacterium]